MFDFYCKLIENIHLGDEDYEVLKEKGEYVISKCGKELEEAHNIYVSENYSFESVEDNLEKIAEKCNLSPSAIYFIFFILYIACDKGQQDA